jgi:hypothetical protein
LTILLSYASACSTKKSVNGSNSNTTSPTHNTTTATTTYKNSSVKFSGPLAEFYVDFSFDYPSSWERDEDAGKASSPNFVKVEKFSDDEKTIENFAVGYFSGQADLMPKLANDLSNDIARGFPEYKKVSEGPTKIGNYDGYEFKFTSHTSEQTQQLDIWGRAVLIPGNDQRNGAVLLMMATSAGDQVKGVDDLGNKGELPIILNSFRFAKP